MKTITISYYEPRDIVECISDWRDWKEGEKAEVISTSWERESYMSNQFLRLRPLNNSKKDINLMYAYNFKLSK